MNDFGELLEEMNLEGRVSVSVEFYGVLSQCNSVYIIHAI